MAGRETAATPGVFLLLERQSVYAVDGGRAGWGDSGHPLWPALCVCKGPTPVSVLVGGCGVPRRTCVTTPGTTAAGGRLSAGSWPTAAGSRGATR